MEPIVRKNDSPGISSRIVFNRLDPPLSEGLLLSSRPRKSIGPYLLLTSFLIESPMPSRLSSYIGNSLLIIDTVGWFQ